MCTSSPKVPDVVVPPEPPKITDPAIAGARDAERQRNASRQGLAGTRLTGGLGGSGSNGSKPMAGGL